MHRESERPICDTCKNNDECRDGKLGSGAYLYVPYTSVELIEAPSSGHMNRREWKKSQKKIRRERRQRMAYKKGKVRK